MRRGPSSAPEHGGHGRRVGVIQHVPGPAQPRADRAARGHQRDDPVEKGLRSRRSVRRRGERGGRGDGHRADDGLTVLVRGIGGDLGLMGGLLRVVRVPGAQRSDAHGGTVAPRPLAVEERRGQLAPVAALPDQPQQPVDRGAVPPVEVVVRGEGLGESVLINPPVCGEHGDDGTRHLGVVGPLPGARGQLAALEQRIVHRHEELGAERVTHGQSAQGGQGALQAPGGRGISGHRTATLTGARL